MHIVTAMVAVLLAACGQSQSQAPAAPPPPPPQVTIAKPVSKTITLDKLLR